MPTRLAADIERVAAYTQRHPELRAAHHFLYDLRHPQDGTAGIVVMGVNPGETANDWKIAPGPTEESSRFDFHTEHGGGRSAIRWSRAARYFLDDTDYVLTELFFWSSHDSREFRARFGPLSRSPHLPFCVELNRTLIEAHQPKAVVLPGLTHLQLAVKLYGLTVLEMITHEGHRVAELCTDGKRPWVFTKHWTAAFGFSRAQRQVVREVIRHALF